MLALFYLHVPAPRSIMQYTVCSGDVIGPLELNIATTIQLHDIADRHHFQLLHPRIRDCCYTTGSLEAAYSYNMVSEVVRKTWREFDDTGGQISREANILGRKYLSVVEHYIPRVLFSIYLILDVSSLRKLIPKKFALLDI